MLLHSALFCMDLLEFSVTVKTSFVKKLNKYFGHFTIYLNNLIQLIIYFVCTCLTLNTFHTAKVDQVKFDVMELHARPELAAQQRMVDDGSGDVKVHKPNTQT